MTIPQIFLIGYALAFILGGIVAWVYRGVKIDAIRIEHNNAHDWWCEAESIIRDLEKRLNRFASPPRDKSTGRFK